MKVRVFKKTNVGNYTIGQGTRELNAYEARCVVNTGRGEYIREEEAEAEIVEETGLDIKITKTLEENGISVDVAKEMSIDELVALDGIGEKTAEKILES